jgi:uncharacterized membrane protein
VKIASRVTFGLSLFLGTTGVVYLLTSYEKQGTVHLIVAAVAFAYIGLVTRAAARQAEAVPPEDRSSILKEEAAELPEGEIEPTIWPVGFALAVVGLVLGVTVQHWLLIVGGLLFIAAAVGWFQDIRRQHRHAHVPGSVQAGSSDSSKA